MQRSGQKRPGISKEPGVASLVDRQRPSTRSRGIRQSRTSRGRRCRRRPGKPRHGPLDWHGKATFDVDSPGASTAATIPPGGSPPSGRRPRGWLHGRHVSNSESRSASGCEATGIYHEPDVPLRRPARPCQFTHRAARCGVHTSTEPMRTGLTLHLTCKRRPGTGSGLGHRQPRSSARRVVIREPQPHRDRLGGTEHQPIRVVGGDDRQAPAPPGYTAVPAAPGSTAIRRTPRAFSSISTSSSSASMARRHATRRRASRPLRRP